MAVSKRPFILTLVIMFVMVNVIALVIPVKKAEAAATPYVTATWNQQTKSIEVDWGWEAGSIDTPQLNSQGGLYYGLYCNNTKVELTNGGNSYTPEGSLTVSPNKANSGKAFIYNISAGKTYSFTLKGESSDLPILGPTTVVAGGNPGGFTITPTYANNVIQVAWQRDDPSQPLTITYKTPGIFNTVTKEIAVGEISGTDTYQPGLGSGGLGLGGSSCDVKGISNGQTQSYTVSETGVSNGTTMLPDNIEQQSKDAEAASAAAIKANNQAIELESAMPLKDSNGRVLTYTGGPITNFFAKMIAQFIATITNTLMFAAGAKDIEEIVFLKGDNNLLYGWLNAELIAIAKYLYVSFLALALALVSVPLLKAGFVIISDIPNVIRKNAAKEEVSNIVIGIFFMILFPFIFYILNELNYAIVSQVSTFVLADHRTGQTSAEVALTFGNSIYGYNFGDIILTAFAWLTYAIIRIWINILFFIRSTLLVLLYGIAPLMALFYMLGGAAKRTGYMTFLSEVVSNIFMGSAYAIGIGVCMQLMLVWHPDGLIGTIFVRVGLLFVAVKFSSFLRRLICGWLNLLGFDEEGTAGQMTGMAAGLGLGTAKMLTGGVAGRLGAKANRMEKTIAGQESGAKEDSGGDGGGRITTISKNTASGGCGAAVSAPGGSGGVASSSPSGGGSIGGSSAPRTSSYSSKKEKEEPDPFWVGTVKAGAKAVGSYSGFAMEQIGGGRSAVAIRKRHEEIGDDVGSAVVSRTKIKTLTAQPSGFDGGRT